MHIWIKFSKKREVCFISHRDILKTMIRALRRANLPLVYSQGFNPHPKVTFAAPLALGMTSEAEYMELELAEEMPLSKIASALSSTLPRGFEVLDLYEVKTKQPKLMAWVERSLYDITFKPLEPYPVADLTQQVKKFMQNEELTFSKKTKKITRVINVKDWIHSLDVLQGGENIELRACLQTGQNGNFKVNEFLQVIENNTEIRCATLPFSHRLAVYGRIGERFGTPEELLAAHNLRSERIDR